MAEASGGAEAPSAAPGNGSPKRPGDELAGAVVTLDVHGLSCPLCANNLDRELLRLPGVRSVQVDLGSGTVRLTRDPSVRLEQRTLAETVRRSGFTLVAIR